MVSAVKVKHRKSVRPSQAKYVLKLYVTGSTPRSQNAIYNLRKLLEEDLAGEYYLEVIDLYQQPSLAKGEQILGAPTLIKKLPLPIRRLVGDMSDRERVLFGLDLRKVGSARKSTLRDDQ